MTVATWGVEEARLSQTLRLHGALTEGASVPLSRFAHASDLTGVSAHAADH